LGAILINRAPNFLESEGSMIWIVAVILALWSLLQIGFLFIKHPRFGKHKEPYITSVEGASWWLLALLNVGCWGCWVIWFLGK